MARSEEDRYEILNTYLEQILSGQETFSDILVESPELEDSLRQQLEAATWLTERKAGLNLRPGFLPASRQRLLRRIQDGNGVGVYKPRVGIWSWLTGLWPKNYAFRVVLIFGIFCLLFLMTTRAALAAQTSIPGDSLYGVKVAQEKLQLAFSFTVEGDAQLHIKFAQRRLVELEALILEGRFEYARATADEYEKEVDVALAMITELAEQGGENVIQLAADLESVLSSHSAVFMFLAATVPEETRVELDRVISVSTTGITSLQELDLPRHPSLKPTDTPTTTLTPTSLVELISPATPTPTPTVTVTEAIPGRLLTPAVIPSATRTVPRSTATSTRAAISTATATDSPDSPVLPTATPESVPTQVGVPTQAPVPTKIPSPTFTPVPTPTPVPTQTTEPTQEPYPTSADKPKPKPTNPNRPTPQPTNPNRPTPLPTNTNRP